MAVKIRLSTLIWITVGLGMFAVSIWLTDKLTRLAPDLIATRSFTPDKSPFQMAAVFTAQPVDLRTGFEYSVDYTESRDTGRSQITFGVHPADDPIILLSSQADPPACYLVDNFFDPDPLPEEKLGAAILNDPNVKQTVYEYRPKWPKPDAPEQIVRCYTPSLAHDESFTRRAADFVFDSRKPPDAMTHYPVPTLLYRFSGIPEARDMDFRGGIETQEDREARDTTRFLDAGRIMSVTWEQASRQSLRDTLLIVIGTLIGIGVTVLIEAAKPYVELLDRPRKPVVVAEPTVEAAPPSAPPPPPAPTT